MAAYAALASLMNLMNEMQNHPLHSFSFHKKQMEYLLKYSIFLLDYTDGFNSHGGDREGESLESRIASAAYSAADVIESHIVDQIHGGSTLYGETRSYFLVGVQKVIEEMDSIKELVVKLKVKRGSNDRLDTFSTPMTSSKVLTYEKNTIVGFDEVSFRLMDVLTRQESGRQIIPVVGMGGIGKTTLARNVYEDSLIVQHFDFRAWATVSQGYSVLKILLQLLSCQGQSASETYDELGERLHKKLSGRRYLIVLDDMWNIEVWDKIKFYFPDNGNRSRIVITTRISNLALHFTSFSLAMNFLDEENSWMLFCEKAFGEEGCPPQFEEIGKKIVKKCKGLPLSIVVIGGHLRNSLRTKEYWENVAIDLNSVLDSGEDERCLSILSLSYNNLPAHLKPCFLYTGIFPEDEEIRVSRLVKLWVAEGFLKPSGSHSLEEVAEVYLKDLIERNLILVHKWSPNGKIKICKIHDILRELCLVFTEKEKMHFDMEWPSEVLNISCSSDCRLRKVHFANYQEMDESNRGRLETNFEEVNLRYIDRRFIRKGFPRNIFPLKAFLLQVHFHSSIFLLWNLQTLIITEHLKRFIAPYEIWEMSKLRHLLIKRQICLPDPPPSDQEDVIVLQNLQTLLKVENFSLSEEVCQRIPNIKKLHLLYDEDASSNSYYCLHNLGRFKELTSLTLHFAKASNWHDFALNLPFISSLKKLSLSSPILNWEDLTMFGLSLPHLEVLKLFYTESSGVGLFDGDFPGLKSLKIWGGYNFNYWNVDFAHFPILEYLTLDDSSALAEIPSGIGEISTLQYIELIGCSVSAAVSAMRIMEEQESYGNESLQLHIDFKDSTAERRFWEMIHEEDLTSNKLHLKSSYRRT